MHKINLNRARLQDKESEADSRFCTPPQKHYLMLDWGKEKKKNGKEEEEAVTPRHAKRERRRNVRLSLQSKLEPSNRKTEGEGRDEE